MPSWHEPGENTPPLTGERLATAFLWVAVLVLVVTWVYALYERFGA